MEVGKWLLHVRIGNNEKKRYSIVDAVEMFGYVVTLRKVALKSTPLSEDESRRHPV